MRGRLILSLCDFSGAWSQPYIDAGYEVQRVDLKTGQDVRLLEFAPGPVHGILAAPPCTHLALSGARWWEGKGEAALLESLAVVDACLRAVAVYRPEWWAIENPVGRLSRYLGPAKFGFDPHDYGDPYTKRTHLWGHFTPPLPLWSGGDRSVEPLHTSSLKSPMMQLGGRSERTKTIRSTTPAGFARAFYLANP